MELPRERQKIGGPERYFAKIGKAEACHIGTCLRHMNRVAEHIEGHWGAARHPGQSLKRAGERRRRACVRGQEINRVVPQLLQPEVGAGFEADNLHSLFEHSNKRQEERAMRPS